MGLRSSVGKHTFVELVEGLWSGISNDKVEVEVVTTTCIKQQQLSS